MKKGGELAKPDLITLAQCHLVLRYSAAWRQPAVNDYAAKNAR